MKELEAAGVIERRAVRSEKGVFEYRMTEAGQDLRTVVDAVGSWGQKWIDKKQSLKNLDPAFLMWDMRRNLKPSPPPERRTVIQFSYPELPLSKRCYWLVVEPQGEVDLCSSDPGFEVDLYVSANLRTMTAIWLGLTALEQERDTVRLTGTRDAARAMRAWFGVHKAEHKAIGTGIALHDPERRVLRAHAADSRARMFKVAANSGLSEFTRKPR
jgi:HxlR-like helix-turn-helix